MVINVGQMSLEKECLNLYSLYVGQKFFDMLATAQAPLWEGCEYHLELSASLACLSLKSDYKMLEGYFNRMVQLMGDTMPKKQYYG